MVHHTDGPIAARTASSTMMAGRDISTLVAQLETPSKAPPK